MNATAPRLVVHHPKQGRVDRVMGTTVDYKLVGDETGGTLLVAEIEAPVGSGVPSHAHAFEDETFIVQAGEVEFVVGDAKILARSGTLVFGPRGIAHSWTATRHTRMLVLVSPAGLEKMLAELDKLGGDDADAALAVCARYGVSFP